MKTVVCCIVLKRKFMKITVCATRRYKMPDSKPILTYFEGRGKGEFVRLMLTAAGVDVRKIDTHFTILGLKICLLISVGRQFS